MEEKNNNGYYSGNTNIIQTLVDCSIDTVLLISKASIPFFKWLFDGWIEFDNTKEEPKVDVERDSNKFFENAGLTINNEFPKLTSRIDSDNYYSYTYRLPIGMCIVDFETKIDRFAAFYNCDKDDLRFISRGSDIEVQVMKPIDSIIYKPDIFRRNDFKVPLGYDKYLNIVLLDLFDSNNFGAYSAGAAGSGKTRTVRLIIAHLINSVSPKDLEIVIADYKGIDLSIFKKAKHVISYITGYNDTVKTLQDQIKEMKRRYDFLSQLDEEKDCNTIWEARENGYNIPFRLLVIEEASAYADNKEYQAAMKNLAERGRAAGIIPLVVVQLPNKDNLPSTIKNNFSVKLGHRVDSELRSEIIAGKDSGLEKLKGYGNNKVFFPEYPEGIEYQEFDITKEIIKEIVNNNK